MNIIIIGGGTVGTIVAEYFSKEGNSVTVIDDNPARLRLLQDRMDITTIEGKGADHSVLENAGLKNTDFLLALTDSDETNIIACTMAKVSGVARRLARMNDAHFLGTHNLLSLRELGVDAIVNTSECLTREITKMMTMPGMTDIHACLEGELTIVKFSFHRGSVHEGKQLGEISFPFPCVPIGYQKIGDYSPYDPSVTVNEFVYGYYACATQDLQKLHAILAPDARTIRRVMLYGGGYKSRYGSGELGMALQQAGVDQIELITEDEEEARRFSARYPFPVMFDDPSRPHFAQTNLRGADAFIGMSPHFERNLYACASAHREGVPYTIPFVRYPEHTALASFIPLTHFLNPAIVTANRVLRHHRADTVLSRTIVEYGQAECAEILIQQHHPLAGKTSAQIPLRHSRCIGVLRDRALLPLSDIHGTVFQSGDRLLLLVLNGDVDHLRSIL